MNPLLSPLHVQRRATCWAPACNWLFLPALASPSLGLHRRHRWCRQWRRCRHHPDNYTQTQKCALEDDHLNSIIECLEAPPRLTGSDEFEVKLSGKQSWVGTPAQRQARQAEAQPQNPPPEHISLTVLGSGPSVFCSVFGSAPRPTEGITVLLSRQSRGVSRQVSSLLAHWP